MRIAEAFALPFDCSAILQKLPFLICSASMLRFDKIPLHALGLVTPFHAPLILCCCAVISDEASSICFLHIAALSTAQWLYARLPHFIFYLLPPFICPCHNTSSDASRCRKNKMLAASIMIILDTYECKNSDISRYIA